MLSVEEARARILSRARLTDVEQVPLHDAFGRVPVVSSVIAGVDVPPFANSSMDGFALRAADAPAELPPDRRGGGRSRCAAGAAA